MPPSAIHAELLATLAAICGPQHLLSQAHGDDLGGYLQDWRQRARGQALAVALPSDTAQVAAVVRACAAARQRQRDAGDAAAAAPIGIVAQGGNTGLAVGSVPDGSGGQLVLSLRRMNAIRALDAANLTLTAEAGCILHTAQQAAQDAGLLLPLSLAAEGSCTLGGNLATNAGGTQVVRYGNARELCLGLEVVTAQGEIWHGLSGLRKDNTGYDLRHLMIGSEGTLGIITAATMKLAPQPAAQLTAWAALPSLQAAVDLLALAHRHLGAGLTGFEVMGDFALRLVARHFAHLRVPLLASAGGADVARMGRAGADPGSANAAATTTSATTAPPFFALLELSDTESQAHARARLEALLQAALEQGCACDAVVAHSIAQARTLWQVRESIPLAQAHEGLNIKHDIALPISRIPAFVAETDALLARHAPGARTVNFGHLGDGNLHYNVQAPPGHDPAAFLRDHEARVNRLVFDQVAAHGGSISAEHGIGSLKVDTLAHYKPAVALEMMRAIKRALDPLNLLNPGRVLRPGDQTVVIG